jgi:hypothetical protein
MDLIDIPVVPQLNLTADVTLERQLVSKIEKQLVGVPIGIALNVFSRLDHALKSVVAGMRAQAQAAQGSPVKEGQGGQMKIAD